MSDKKPPPRREDFDIAIICALKKEGEAVEKLFNSPDETWEPRFIQHHRDQNRYSFGRIGNHLVALVWMPRYGKAQAAIAGSNLKTSFPKIKHVFVVGICGGLPSANEEEVLLGDVIISTALKRYDEGKQYDGRYQATESRDLGDEMHSFLNKLEGAGRSKLIKLSAHYLKEKFNETKWRYRGAQEDKLYDPAYIHKHRDNTICACTDTRLEDGVCERAADLLCTDLNCGNGNLVPRHRLKEMLDRDPSMAIPDSIMHFGPIASGDTVMKSGASRDRIAKEIDVIGFEMEGVGVSETWQNVVVIKGVCDYADSHKDKKWQRHAAATAAACMRAVLAKMEEEIPESRRSRRARFRSSIAHTGQTLGQNLREATSRITSPRRGSLSRSRSPCARDDGYQSESDEDTDRNSSLIGDHEADHRPVPRRNDSHATRKDSVSDFASRDTPTDELRITVNQPKATLDGNATRECCCASDSPAHKGDLLHESTGPPSHHSGQPATEHLRVVSSQDDCGHKVPGVPQHGVPKLAENQIAADMNGKLMFYSAQPDQSPKTVEINVTEVRTEAKVPEVIKPKKDVEKTNQLLDACKNRDLETIKLLLQNRDIIDMAQPDSKGRNMLHLAVNTGKVSSNASKMHTIATIVDLLCGSGKDIDPNEKDPSGHCPIHYCAKAFNTEATKRLIHHGADVNTLDPNGRTALYFTTEDRNPDVEFVKMLLQQKAILGKGKPTALLPRANQKQKAVRASIGIR